MSKARERVRRGFAAKAAKIRQDRAQAIGELQTAQPPLSKRLLDQGIREVEAAAEHDMEKLRMSYGDALSAELSKMDAQLWGPDESSTLATSGAQKMAWRDAVQRAQNVSTVEDATMMFAASVMVGDTMMLKALGLVGKTHGSWGPVVHKLWRDFDERAAALMDEYDELEEEMGNSEARIRDMAELSLRGVPTLAGDGGGAPQLAD